MLISKLCWNYRVVSKDEFSALFCSAFLICVLQRRYISSFSYFPGSERFVRNVFDRPVKNILHEISRSSIVFHDEIPKTFSTVRTPLQWAVKILPLYIMKPCSTRPHRPFHHCSSNAPFRGPRPAFLHLPTTASCRSTPHASRYAPPH